MADADLTGTFILVVEDDYFTASDIGQQLSQRGATVIGPAPSLDHAMALIDTSPRIDAGILDINLGGEMVFPAADKLRERQIPFLFATGYDASVVPPRFTDVIRCEKPVSADEVVGALSIIMSRYPPARSAS